MTNEDFVKFATALYMKPNGVTEPPFLMFASKPFGHPVHATLRIDSELGFDWELSTFTNITSRFWIECGNGDYNRAFVDDIDVDGLMRRIIGFYEDSIQRILKDEYLTHGMTQKEFFELPIYDTDRM